MKVEHNGSGSSGQFEAHGDSGHAGKMTYSRKGENVMVIEHTEVNPEFQGQGVGKQMVQSAADYARDNNMKIVPQCSYAKKVMERGSDYDDVLA